MFFSVNTVWVFQEREKFFAFFLKILQTLPACIDERGDISSYTDYQPVIELNWPEHKEHSFPLRLDTRCIYDRIANVLKFWQTVLVDCLGVFAKMAARGRQDHYGGATGHQDCYRGSTSRAILSGARMTHVLRFALRHHDCQRGATGRRIRSGSRFRVTLALLTKS